MKKLLIIIAAVLCFSTASFAQAKPSSEKAKAATSKTTPADTKKASTAAPVKKDGTPDMRYKANKEAAKTAAPAGPLKKDGTPDMRHKANKEAAAKKKG
ncbi:MAG: hypothetical protein HYU71_12745 [Bacteroidetes bacterium]|nr:hypothetical protein [Bacteroidota bacterium]